MSNQGKNLKYKCPACKLNCIKGSALRYPRVTCPNCKAELVSNYKDSIKTLIKHEIIIFFIIVIGLGGLLEIIITPGAAWAASKPMAYLILFLWAIYVPYFFKKNLKITKRYE